MEMKGMEYYLARVVQLDHTGVHGFPREVGLPWRFVVNDAQTYLDAIEQHNGKRNCYVSVYHYKDVKNYKTAILDKIFLDFDSKSGLQSVLFEIRNICDFFVYNKIFPRVYFSGRKGFHIFLDILVVSLQLPRDSIRSLIQNIAYEYELRYLDFVVVGDLARISRIPNTQHMKSGLYCIPLTNSEIFDLELKDILELAKTQRTDVRINKTLSNVIRDWLIDFDEGIQQDRQEQNLLDGYTLKNDNYDENNGIRPCIQALIHSAKNSNFALDHNERLAILFELLNNDYSDNDIIPIFSKQTDFDVNITDNQIQQARSKNYKPFKCKTLKYELGVCLSNCNRR